MAGPSQPAAYDAIVIGVGGVGSAALYHLARRGTRVLGLDPYPPGHDRGSSHGQTRIIRQAYFEHPSYVPLLRQAYDAWHELEAESGRQLFHQIGLVEIGPPEGVVLPGVLRAARQYQLPVEQLDRDEAQRRFPGLRVPEGCAAVYEANAGYLLVEECVRVQADLAQRHGGELRTGEAVRGWCRDGRGFRVETDNHVFRATRLIITAGGWAAGLLPQLPVPLRVLVKHLHWYPAGGPEVTEVGGCPTFFYELPEGYFYGFPARDARGVKVAEHSGGRQTTNPDDASRQLEAEDRRRVERFLEGHLPACGRPASEHCVCFYTMSPDEHFLLDRYPGEAGVLLAAGLSGHGFKFSAELGRRLAAWTLGQPTDRFSDFLSLARFSEESARPKST